MSCCKEDGGVVGDVKSNMNKSKKDKVAMSLSATWPPGFIVRWQTEEEGCAGLPDLAQRKVWIVTTSCIITIFIALC